MLQGSHRGRSGLLLLLRRQKRSLPFFLAFSLVSSLGAQDVLTYHNDNARTGQNLNEVILTPSNVNSALFGKLFQVTVDGKVDAEPLYASAVPIPGQGTHNMLYVATEHASVYAFDADTGTQLWQVSLLLSGETPSDDRGCGQVTPEIGITATPVIDRSSGPNGTIYAVAMSKDSTPAYHQRLHALDMTTGAEVFGGPKEVQATFPGKGDNSNGTNVIFDPAQYKERPGLLLLNQVIYTAWSSHCDIEPYTAWVIAYNESSLNQVTVLDLTPNGHEGSVWMSGAGMAADSAGNIFFLMANGTFDTTLDANGFPSQGDYGNAFMKLSTANSGLAVADYFTMSNTVAESNADEDFGSGGALLLPDMTDASGATRHLAVGAGKDQAIYLVDRDNMGKFNPSADNIYQEIFSALPGGIWSMPAYFNDRLFYGPVGDNLLAFQFANARLETSPVSRTSTTFVYPGATPSISANGTLNGIVWATENTDPAVLHAYDATDVAHELYNSNQTGARDQFGAGNKFITPMIANGKVYVGTTNGVGVFGLLTAKATTSPTSLSFSSELVGATSSAQPVTLTNPGQTALAITTIAASGDFAEANNCGGSLAAGANCTISVTFKPTAGGARTGTLTITDNASGGPQTVTLSGAGEDFTLSVGSGGSTSATVSPGQSAMYTLNVGGEGGFNQSVTFTCSGAPRAAACTASPSSLTPGGSATNVTITVTTTAPSTSAPRPQPLPPVLPLLFGPTGMVMLFLLLGSLAWGVHQRRQLRGSRQRAASLILAAALMLTLAMALAGCGGGGGGGSGTPAGTYTLTVTGSTGAGFTALQHSINLSLTIS